LNKTNGITRHCSNKFTPSAKTNGAEQKNAKVTDDTAWFLFGPESVPDDFRWRCRCDCRRLGRRAQESQTVANSVDCGIGAGAAFGMLGAE